MKTKIIILVTVFTFLVIYPILYMLARPVISVKDDRDFGTLYQHRTGTVCFIPKADSGLYADSQAKTIWLATCVKDKSKFNLNGYLHIALERKHEQTP